MNEPAKKEKLTRPFDTQCLQYWQMSTMVRRGLNPTSMEPLNQPPHQTLALMNKWLDLLLWSKPLLRRMLDMKYILEREVQDYDEQKLKANC